MGQITVAASEDSFRRLFAALRDRFTFEAADSGSFARFTAGYDVKCHLEDGTIDLRNDNTAQVRELDIVWDRLRFNLGFDIPEICVGGWCILPTPWGCAIHLPRICVFSANPDVSVSLDLSGLVRSEISLVASPVTRYRVDPARLPTMTDLDAEDANIPNLWQLFLDPRTIDLDVFDIADMVGDLLVAAVRNVIDNLLWWLPGWAKDIIWAILGPVIDLIRAILDLPDDIAEWISNLLGVSLGFFNLILTFVADYFAARNPLHAIEDPYPILESSGGLIPVKLPIRDLAVRINTDEMILEANVGG